MATLTVYPDANPESTSVDGMLYIDAHEDTWAQIHDAATGDGAYPSLTSAGVRLYAHTTNDRWADLYWTALLFDTSSLGSSAEKEAAVLSLWMNNVYSNDFTSSIGVVTCTPSSNTDLAAADYDQRGTVRQASDIAFSSISTGQYNDFNLNSTGIENVSLTDISKFAVAIDHDIDDSEPTWASQDDSQLDFYTADQAGTTNDPKLVITYTLPAGGIYTVI